MIGVSGTEVRFNCGDLSSSYNLLAGGFIGPTGALSGTDKTPILILYNTDGTVKWSKYIYPTSGGTSYDDQVQACGL